MDWKEKTCNQIHSFTILIFAYVVTFTSLFFAFVHLLLSIILIQAKVYPLVFSQSRSARYNFSQFLFTQECIYFFLFFFCKDSFSGAGAAATTGQAEALQWAWEQEQSEWWEQQVWTWSAWAGRGLRGASGGEGSKGYVGPQDLLST